MDGNGCSIGTHILSYKPKKAAHFLRWAAFDLVRCVCVLGVFYSSAILSRMLRMMDTRMLPIKAEPKPAMEMPTPNRLIDR